VRAEVRAALAEAGATALLVTHDQEEALSLADLVAVMRDGRIVQAADPQAVYRDPVDLGVATAVGDAVLLECELVDGHAETVLGRVPARGAEGLAGAVTLMLRPEQIRCDEPHRDAVRGRVRSTEFYGHDAVARVMLGESGPEVLARTTGHLVPQPGQEVGLAIDGTAVAYPAPDRGPRHPGSAAGRSDRSRIPGDVRHVELVPRA
jgi:iron(III) transport system ATP-binding protein